MTLKLETVLALHPHSKPFWDATETGKLLLPLCADCKQFHWYPRPFCPHCYSFNLTWHEATGKGKVHTSSMMRRAAVPYIVAAVELDEGPIVLTNIISEDVSQAAIGTRVRVGFDYLNGSDRKMPVFFPDNG